MRGGHIDLAYAGGAAYRERLLAFLASSLRAGAKSRRRFRLSPLR